MFIVSPPSGVVHCVQKERPEARSTMGVPVTPTGSNLGLQRSPAGHWRANVTLPIRPCIEPSSAYTLSFRYGNDRSSATWTIIEVERLRVTTPSIVPSKFMSRARLAAVPCVKAEST